MNYTLSREIHPGIFQIKLPLAGEKPGPVNAYLFKGENITLLDTGTLRSSRKLLKALKEHGLSPEDLDQLIITHGHMDHYGAANTLAGQSGAKVRVGVHEADMKRVKTGADVSREAYEKFIGMMGVPFPYRIGLRLLTKFFRSMAENCRVDFNIEDGDEIQMGNYLGRIIFTPGHSKGSVCIFLEDENILFSGDHILGHITPNAFVMLDEDHDLPCRKSQKEFYSSLKKIEEIGPAKIYPAHGGSIVNLRKIAGIYKESFKEREAKIIEIIDSSQFTVYEIARTLFPKLGKRRLPLEIFLSISEVFTHLQVIEEKGEISFVVENGLLIIKK